MLGLLSLITRRLEFGQARAYLVPGLSVIVTRLIKLVSPSSSACRRQTLGSSQCHLLTELCPDAAKEASTQLPRFELQLFLHWPELGLRPLSRSHWPQGKETTVHCIRSFLSPCWAGEVIHFP